MPRPRTIEIRNTALAARIGQTSLTYRAITEQINTVSSENGHPARYNPGSLSHWLTGRTPDPAVIPAIVEAFRRLLKISDLTAEDLGWEVPASAPTHPSPTEPAADPSTDLWQADPLARLDHLGRIDMTHPDRRDVLFSLPAATLPALLPTLTPASSPAPVNRGRAGAADAARIREMTAAFADMDDRFGGGHARPAVATYLTDHVVPLLRHTTGRSRPALLAATAELAYLAGWMASDAGAAGLAQRYYIQSVRLAAQAGDHRIQATALRAMALQCVELGHARHGQDLADAAARTLPAGAPPRLRSWIRAMQAEATAAAGNPQAARELLRRAERDLERATALRTPGWTGTAFSHAALQHQTGNTLAAAGNPVDLASAEEHLAASLTGRPATQRRSRALIGTRLAALQVRRHHPADAAQTLQAITPDLQMIESARVDHQLSQLRTGWKAARNEPVVKEVDDTIAALLRRRHR